MKAAQNLIPFCIEINVLKEIKKKKKKNFHDTQLLIPVNQYGIAQELILFLSLTGLSSG